MPRRDASGAAASSPRKRARPSVDVVPSARPSPRGGAAAAAAAAPTTAEGTATGPSPRSAAAMVIAAGASPTDASGLTGGFGQRMRQRPLVVDKTLPVVTDPNDIPAGALLDDGSGANPDGSPRADGEAALAAAGADVEDPGLVRSMSQPDRQLEIQIPSFVVDAAYGGHFRRTPFDLPHAYVRRKPKVYDSVIDYDMDNEDVAWLTELRENTQARPEGSFPSISEETFERWMDAFEKEALRKDPPPALHDEEVEVGFSGVAFRRRVAGQRKSRMDGAAQYTPCCVCWHVGGSDRNPLVFCNRCHLAVHTGCYGAEKKRGSSHRGGTPWFCTRCEDDVAQVRQQAASAAAAVVAAAAVSSAAGGDDGVASPKPAAAAESPKAAAAAASALEPAAQVVPGWGVGSGQCCLCPVKGGALKPTDDGRWCHLVCAIWIPEPCISDIARMQPVERLNKISSKRRRLQCAVCNSNDDGPCIECSESGCLTAFHPSCAYTASPDYCLQASLQPDRQAVSFEAFCPEHNARMRERYAPGPPLRPPRSLTASIESLLTVCVFYDVAGRLLLRRHPHLARHCHHRLRATVMQHLQLLGPCWVLTAPTRQRQRQSLQHRRRPNTITSANRSSQPRSQRRPRLHTGGRRHPYRCPTVQRGTSSQQRIYHAAKTRRHAGWCMIDDALLTTLCCVFVCSHAVFNHWVAKRQRRGGVLLWRTEEPLTAKMVSPRAGRAGMRKKTPEQLEQHYIRLRVMRQELEKLRLLVDLVKKRELVKQSLYQSSREQMDAMLQDEDDDDDDGDDATNGEK